MLASAARNVSKKEDLLKQQCADDLRRSRARRVGALRHDDRGAMIEQHAAHHFSRWRRKVATRLASEIRTLP